MYSNIVSKMPLLITYFTPTNQEIILVHTNICICFFLFFLFVHLSNVYGYFNQGSFCIWTRYNWKKMFLCLSAMKVK